MSKPAVLISIRSVWCGKIFDGFKNLEFRKSKPYFPPPFKCYVYCTQKRERLLEIIKDGDDVYGDIYHGKPIFIKTDAHGNDTTAWINGWCKKVIGEFTVDRIEEVTVDYSGENPVAFYGAEKFLGLPPGYIKSGGLTLGKFEKYKCKGKIGAYLVLCERGDWDGYKYPMIGEPVLVKVDGEMVKADTWYMLKNGEIVEEENE